MSADDADSAARNAAARMRLTPTERLHEVTMAAMTRQAAPPEHNAEVSRNREGIYLFTVTVRGHDLDAVIQSTRDSAEKLAAWYPYPAANGNDAA